MNEKGVLFSPDEAQDSSGGLNSTFSPPDKDFEKSIEPLEIVNIQHSLIIPDFIEPTRSRYPIIVRSPSTFQCIDGWDLIEQSQRKGETSLTCEIIHIQQDSEIDVAIWKASVRTMSPGGTCIYPEKVGNTCHLFTMLGESALNPVIFSHGGARRGESFTDIRDKNIRLVLAERLGKSVTTINKYLQHGDYLSDNALLALVDADVSKGFFEEIQQYKGSLINELKSEHKSDEEITCAVSEIVLSNLRQNQHTGEVENDCVQNDHIAKHPIISKTQQIPVRSADPKPKIHKHWSGNNPGAQDTAPTIDDVRMVCKTVGSKLYQLDETEDLTIPQLIEIVSQQVIALSLLIQQLKHLDNQKKVGRGEN